LKNSVDDSELLQEYTQVVGWFNILYSLFVRLRKGNVIVFILVAVVSAFLVLVYVLSLAIGYKASQNSLRSSINQPVKGTINYKDAKFPINFNYPANWVVVSHDATENMLKASKDKPLSSSVKDLWVSDIPHPLDGRSQYPTCEISIGVHSNPQVLPLSDWFKLMTNETIAPPKNPEEQQLYDSLQKTNQLSDIVLNGNHFLRFSTHAADNYMYSDGDKVFYVAVPNETNCRSGFDVILSSFKFN
jgi:hypothetical protein